MIENIPNGRRLAENETSMMEQQMIWLPLHCSTIDDLNEFWPFSKIRASMPICIIKKLATTD